MSEQVVAGHAAPFPTTLEYEADEYGAPVNVRINGQAVTGVQQVLIDNAADHYNEVVIVIHGVHVTSRPHKP